MVVVPQEGFLFNGTLMENVRLARPDATDDQIVDAMDSIGILHRFAVLPRSEERRVGKECAVRVDLGGRRLFKKKKKDTPQDHSIHTNTNTHYPLSPIKNQ